MNIIDVIILGLIEGATEFLPISSTGHMILASSALNLQNNEFLKTFEIAIQLGAILAIVCLYANKLLGNVNLYKKLLVAFVPTAAIGLIFYNIIKAHLFNPVIVSITLILGGVVLIALDKKISNNASKHAQFENMSYKNAAYIGLFQGTSVVPGVSRAAATIIGGVFNGLSRKQATEFSFLLAVPTMLAATGYDLIKTSASFSSYEFGLLGLGSLVSFVSAWVAVKLFVNLIDKHGLSFFGYYRIILGTVFLLYFR
jgi:undecaprenyl-diphosphatase